MTSAALLRGPPHGPTVEQVAVTRRVVRWYLGTYHGSPDDPGVLGMFADPARVGHFAVGVQELFAGEPRAYFRLLVATTMFQRRQDLQIQRVLRGIALADVSELTDLDGLRARSAACACPRGSSLDSLLTACDLTKTPSGDGTCNASPTTACALKRHSVLLKRYGHFGKVPTSLAHAVYEAGAPDLPTLRATVLRESADPEEAAERLEAALTRAWRVSDKIAAMYLSMLANPDLSGVAAPWATGLDWTRWVVIDSNVDLFLRAVGYRGTWTYDARRAFIQALAAEVDLSQMKPEVRAYNPRIVQQAAYLFMSATNRRASLVDCSHVGELACGLCPTIVQEICPRRAGPPLPVRSARSPTLDGAPT